MKEETTLHEKLKATLLKYLPEITRDGLLIINSPDSRTFIVNFLPNETLSVGINLIKDAWSFEDPKMFAVRMNLYFEFIVNKIFDKEIERPEILKDYTHYQKIQLFRALGVFDDKLSKDLLYFNRIRNKFAHNLSFDLGNVDMSNFSDLKGVYRLKNYKRKSEKRMLNFFLFRMETVILLFKIREQFSYIALMDIDN